MSNEHWRTKKQIEPFKHGKTRTSKVMGYIRGWEARCYPNGIPDRVPAKIMKSRRAPSYKAIAIALLKNDVPLTSLGFAAPESQWYSKLKQVELEQRK